MKEMSEISDGPFKVKVDDWSAVVGGPVKIPFFFTDCDNEFLKAHQWCEVINKVWHSRDSELASKDARIKELENLVADEQKQIAELKMFDNLKRRAINELFAERDRYKQASLLSRQRISAMLHVWEYRDKEAFVSNAGDELRAVVSLLDEALGGE